MDRQKDPDPEEKSSARAFETDDRYLLASFGSSFQTFLIHQLSSFTTRSRGSMLDAGRVLPLQTATGRTQPQTLFSALAQEMRLRNYSQKTIKAYKS